jgi:hypothetical protein
MCLPESSFHSTRPRKRKCWNTIRLCFLTDAKRFLYRLRCEGRIPQRKKMNLLVRLLLEIKTDFLPFPLVLIASLRASLRHSGIVANIEGVTSGSRVKDPVCAVRIVTAAQVFLPTRALRGPTKIWHDTGISRNTVTVIVTSLD